MSVIGGGGAMALPKTIQRLRGLPSECVVIDKDQILDAVRLVNEAGRPVHAENVRKYLGQFADEGGYFEVGVVAADLEELESLGKLKRAPAIEWKTVGRRLKRASVTYCPASDSEEREGYLNSRPRWRPLTRPAAGRVLSLRTRYALEHKQNVVLVLAVGRAVIDIP